MSSAPSSALVYANQNPFLIEWIKFSSGERLPVLVQRETGLPIEAPTYWITSSERALNKAAATLEKQLRHLMMLYLWARARGVIVEDLIQSPAFLTLEQLNDLDRFCRHRMVDAVTNALRGREDGTSVIRLPLRRPNGSHNFAAGADISDRLATICAFLDYTSFGYASRVEAGSVERQRYDSNRAAILNILKARSRAFISPGQSGEPREGLVREAREVLLAVTTPGHSDNPWAPKVQRRNQLIVRLLYELGIRRGELLNLRVSDVKLMPNGGLLTILRRPQDPEDLRTTKPQVKTLGRELSLGAPLRELLMLYLTERRAYPAARRHPFLFVSTKNGDPLSLWSVTKTFKNLRGKVPSLPAGLSAHVLRHDWNERFSEMSDRASPNRDRVAANKEERARAYAQGWSNPETAAKYTRRWIREAANERSLAMQARQDIQTNIPDDEIVVPTGEYANLIDKTND